MEHYEIQVVGHVDGRRAQQLGCESLRLLPSGRSALTFVAVDQAALYGLLARLRDAGLELSSLWVASRVRPAEFRPPSVRTRSPGCSPKELRT
jgi:hypothetical protein